MSKPLSRRVPIVLLSGMASSETRPGVVTFSPKPIRPDKLLACIKRFCDESSHQIKEFRLLFPNKICLEKPLPRSY